VNTGYYSPDDRRPPITPGLAVRVATLGFIALALFGIVFFRLWFLQVLAGDRYLQEANQNRVRDVGIAAPRGDIVDRNDQPIVKSRLANVVQIDPRSLPQAERDAAAVWGRDAGLLAARWKHRHPKAKSMPLPPIPAASSDLVRRFSSLGRVLNMRPETIQRRVIQSLAVVPYGSIRLRIDVPRSIIQYFQERKTSYPGVVPDTIFLREYPMKTLAAQLLGNVGEVDDKQLKLQRFRGVTQGTVIGKGGVEWTYDRYLRGRDGARRLQVDSMGNFLGELTAARRQPLPGRNLKLSLDLGVQKEGQLAIKKGIGLAHANGHAAPAGAFVAMNPGSGEIYGMGSYPSFDPSEFTKPISDARYKALNSEIGGKPLFDRAVDGAYPTGSTFKPITAFAAVQGGFITPSFSLDDQGCINIGAVQRRCNARNEAFGMVDLVNALRVSSDVYFYTLGEKLNSAHTEVIQNMARKLGLGRRTGIDLPSLTTGVVPDWRWRLDRGKLEAACRKKRHIPLGYAFPVTLAAQRGCGISDMRQWSVGDNVSLAVGQGDVQASPLQMAIAYSAIVEHGRVPRPHLGLEIEDSQNRLVQRITKPAARHIKLDEGARQAILNGLHAAASAPGGTSTAVWQDGWDQNRFPVYGKTGTAQTSAGVDQAWYVCWIKDQTKPNDPGIVIAVTIEKGGFGAESAAPAARLIASKFFGVRGVLKEGTSHTL
jgi:penicillin-binding protein 2